MAHHLKTTTRPNAPEMIVAKEVIDKQATQAAKQGRSLNDACPYPFGTEAADHFTAVFLVAQTQGTDPAAQQDAQA